MLKKRLITAFTGIPLLVAAIWFDEPLPWFGILVAAWGLLAVFEYYRITSVTRFPALAILGLVFTLLFVLSPYFSDRFSLPLLLGVLVLLTLGFIIFIREKQGAFGAWAWAVTGVLYVGLLLSFLVALRLEGGRSWAFLALFVTFASDSTAFFTGRALGRHKLAPSISPGKTWEGALGGLLGGVIASVVIVYIFAMPVGYGMAVLLGLAASAGGQVGDLAESLLKRHTGIKESGRMMPGHGGLLDRMDSVAFAGVVVYLFFLVLSG